VDQATLVGGAEGGAHTSGQPDRLGRRQPAPGPQEFGQRAAPDQLGDDVAHAIVGADVEDGGGVGMVDRGRLPDRQLEPRHQGRVVGDPRVQHLDGDGTFEQQVTTRQHLGDGAIAECATELVPVGQANRCDRHRLLRVGGGPESIGRSVRLAW
jgi:hypothetical protein